MNKYFINTTILGIILLLMYSGCNKKNDANSRPNILLIVSEDHGQHLSCYGDTIIKTPNLDNIAEHGILFRNAYVTMSVCSPSRSSILTGLYPHQNGQLGLATQGYHMVGDVKNIYSLLKKEGYRTGMIGKLHVNPENSFPIDYRRIPGGNFAKKGLDRYANFADSMMTASDTPFLLMVNFPDAHYPWQDNINGLPAKPVSPKDVVSFPYIGVDNPRIRNITAHYYNCLQRLDVCVGELMNKLEASGKSKNTLVIFMSDHGDEMARGKFDIYEASTKVPFLITWPGKVSQGVVTDALISSVDIVPTILDVAGAKIPENLAGKSLVPLFKNPKANFRKFLFTEYNCDPILYFPRRAIRDKRYKLIYTLLDDRKNPAAVYYTENSTPALEGCPTANELQSAPDSVRIVYDNWLEPSEIQLFDLKNDPWEFHDLASNPKYIKVKDRLLDALRQWQIETDDPLRFPEKLSQLTKEHDLINSWGYKDDWQYPKYLYGK